MNKKIQNLVFGIVFLFIFICNKPIINAEGGLCVSAGAGIPLAHIENPPDSPSNEYVVYINAYPIIIDSNIRFVATNEEGCQGKKLILEIDRDIHFNLTGTNQYLSLSGDLNLIRINSTQPNGVFIRFNVNNDETSPNLYNQPGPGVLDINIPIEVETNSGIIGYEKERTFIDSEVDDETRAGYGVKVIFKDISIKGDVDFNISLIANDRKDRNSCVSHHTRYGMHGGVAELDGNSIENYGNLRIMLKGGNGSAGSEGCSGKDKSGGGGGNGGAVRININKISNYSDINLVTVAGTGGNGGSGSNEGGGMFCPGSPASGGSAGNGGDINFSIDKIDNSTNSVFDVFMAGGNGGRGGNAGLDRCQYSDIKPGGDGGQGGSLWLTRVSEIKNNGSYKLIGNAGDGGKGGVGSTYHSKYHRGATGKSRSGGSISDLNFDSIINSDEFTINLKSGKININPIKNTSNINRGTAIAGSIGSMNIGYLYNKVPGLEIIAEINERSVANIISCGCLGSNDCQQSLDEPKIGNVNISYLGSGSYLPKTIKLIKHIPLSSITHIKISSCYLESSGNSEIVYVADNLYLSGANLAQVANDFNNENSKVLAVFPTTIYCPVCDGLELDNPLRIEDDYTIYSRALASIPDLNIYYLTPDGNIFKPPGYPADQNYIIYSLNQDEEIEPSNSMLFGENIKEYKISKNKLYFNPRLLDLSMVDNAKLFCAGQRYLLVYKQGNTTKQMEFTPLFNIR